MQQQSIMHRIHHIHALNSEELRDAKRLYDWALNYEKQGLRIAASVLRDEGRKMLEKFMLAQL